MNNIGINLTASSYWSSQFPWSNIFRASSEWITQNTGFGGPWDTGLAGQIPQDENGYPTSLPFTVNGNASPQVVASLMMRDLNGQYPGGQYVCTYDGEGDIDFKFDAAVVSKEPNRIVINVTPGNGGVLMTIKESKLGNHIRNIKIIKSSEVDAYNSTFLRLMSRFATLRFMDWQQTNNSHLVNWSSRTKPGYYTTTTPNGVSVEDMVHLANTLNRNAWFCMPHAATDDFIQQFAQYVKANLNPGLKVFIEYSNECWNSIFSQANYCLQEGLKNGLATDGFEAQLKFYAKRSKEVFAIWYDVFADQSTRISRVVASQASNVWVAETILSYDDLYANTDVLAIAPYFGGFLGAPGALAPNATVNDIIMQCRGDIVGPVTTWIKAHDVLAKTYNLSLCMYEGGQHLAGIQGVENNQQVTDLFIEANKHPGMRRLYTVYLNTWKHNGGDDAIMFNSIGTYTKWGSWGLLENQTHNPLMSNKLVAVFQWMSRNP